MPGWEIRRRNRIFHRLGNAYWLWPSLKEGVMFGRQCIVQCSFNWVEDYNDHHQPLFSGEMPIEMKKHKAGQLRAMTMDEKLVTKQTQHFVLKY